MHSADTRVVTADFLSEYPHWKEPWRAVLGPRGSFCKARIAGPGILEVRGGCYLGAGGDSWPPQSWVHKKPSRHRPDKCQCPTNDRVLTGSGLGSGNMRVNQYRGVALIHLPRQDRGVGGRTEEERVACASLGAAGPWFACCCVTEDAPVLFWSLSVIALPLPRHSGFPCGHCEWAMAQRGWQRNPGKHSPARNRDVGLASPHNPERWVLVFRLRGAKIG